MADSRPLYLGPRLKRLRRELGLTQQAMADDLGISPSYVALLERNQRPLTADLLLRLARTYKLDMASLTRDGAADDTARLQAVLKDPMFADIDLPALAMVEAAFQAVKDRQRPRLALDALRVIAALGGDCHRIERLQHLLEHDDDELVGIGALDAAVDVDVAIVSMRNPELPSWHKHWKLLNQKS